MPPIPPREELGPFIWQKRSNGTGMVITRASESAGKAPLAHVLHATGVPIDEKLEGEL